MIINESGNVFKNGTVAIKRQDIKDTILWLEKITGLPLQDSFLGSVGKKDTSGDLDLAVDEQTVSKSNLEQHLINWCKSNGLNPAEYVKKSGIIVHFKTPIKGNATNGFVQTDFMFGSDIAWMKFKLFSSGDASKFNGRYRYILIQSIAKTMGLTFGPTGLYDRATKEIITKDPNKVAEIILGKNATSADLESVESILAKIKERPDYETLIADAKETFARDGIALEGKSWYRNVSDSMTVITENSARIQHVEDLIFDHGYAGAIKSIDSLSSLIKSNASSATIKWDGKPAIIFGRNDMGQFVLTDKSAFSAGNLFTSIKELAKHMSERRGGGREDLIAMYASVWPIIESSVPSGFQGYVQADLLYSSTPQTDGSTYVFTPNTVTYKIAKDSAVGQQITNSQIGLAVHTYYANNESSPTPVKKGITKSFITGKVAIFTPWMDNSPELALDTQKLNDLHALVTANRNAIDKTLNKTELSKIGLTDFSEILKRYVNSKIRSGNMSNYIADFPKWLETDKSVSQVKKLRCLDYFSNNIKNITVIFGIFSTVMRLKNQIVKELDKTSSDIQSFIGDKPGGEGYVMTHKGAPLKLVNRGTFSRMNFNKY